ncbi:MAG: MtnX-like HAD-IB family phosphatase [Ignavibacteriae bacterium]|nr:MtnX-like HAD-IB family phosphatase [Ignavibacteriota bacterium]
MKKTGELNLAVFCDFDGTITKPDIGDELFKVYGSFEPYHSQLKEGKLNIKNYWQKVCSELKPGTNAEIIKKFAEDAEVDSYFREFAVFCEDNNIPLSILSDGFDVYINPVMKKLELERISIYCNILKFCNGSPPVPVYPYASESCDCMCASCKRNSMLNNVDDDTVIVYVGDDYSDFCGAEHSDIVFAKKNLAAYCNENRIPHYPYSTFFDILRIMKDILKKKKYKIRHQAKIKRKQAFEAE